MTLKRYPAYRTVSQANVEEVPISWPLKKIRHVARLNPSKSEALGLPLGLLVSFVPMEAIGEDGTLNLERTRPLEDVLTGYTYFRDGDVAFAKITPCFENGKGALFRNLSNGMAFGTTELTVTRPNPRHTMAEYLFWLFSSPAFRKAGEAWMYGAGGQKRVPDEFVREFQIGWPSLQEQKEIVVFLERETAKLDALVAEQKRLIELLKEKRQAIISHAVTKGLDPNVRMKDSGGEWLGEVPEHWEVKRLKYLVLSQQGIQMGPFGGMLKDLPEHATGFKLYGQENTISGDFCRGNRWIEQSRFDELNSYSLRPGDLVLTRKGSIGNCSVVPCDAVPGIADSDTIRVRSDHNKIITGLLVVILQEAPYVRDQLEQTKRGAILSGLNTKVIADLTLAIPPLREQHDIKHWLDIEVGRFDTAMAEAETIIELLKERRAALISAAVTGKIDVRETTAPANVLAHRDRIRPVVAAEIIERVSGRPTFGRVKLQKIVYLTEAYANVNELDGNYIREAAGPFDRNMIKEMETKLQADGIVSIDQPGGRGAAVTYRIKRRGAYRNESAAILGGRAARFTRLIDLLGDFDTKSIEAIATLYAVWNDALIDGIAPTEDFIISAFLNDWHPEKVKKFEATDLRKWLDWMRRHEFIPEGKGPRTLTGRLFP